MVQVLPNLPPLMQFSQQQRQLKPLLRLNSTQSMPDGKRLSREKPKKTDRESKINTTILSIPCRTSKSNSQEQKRLEMQPWLERSTEKLTTGPLNSPPLPLPWTRSTLKKLLKPQLKPTNSSWKQEQAKRSREPPKSRLSKLKLPNSNLRWNGEKKKSLLLRN